MKKDTSAISRFRKGALYSSIAFLSISALLAIGSILTSDFGEFEIKILVTTSIIAAASICSLCCSAYYNRSEKSLPGVGGIALASAAAAMLILGVWGEMRSDAYWKTAVILSIFAVASAHSLATLGVRLRPAHVWIQIVTVANIFILAIVISAMILGEHADDGVLKLVAVLAILAVLETLVVPILGRLTRGSPGQARETLSLTKREDGMYQDPQGHLYEVNEMSGSRTVKD